MNNNSITFSASSFGVLKISKALTRLDDQGERVWFATHSVGGRSSEFAFEADVQVVPEHNIGGEEIGEFIGVYPHELTSATWESASSGATLNYRATGPGRGEFTYTEGSRPSRYGVLAASIGGPDVLAFVLASEANDLRCATEQLVAAQTRADACLNRVAMLDEQDEPQDWEREFMQS